MIIYNPYDQHFIKERIASAQALLEQIPAKYCFISGSFLHQEKYNDSDIFVISRSKKKIVIPHTKAKITILDFNDLYSLFYHSVAKSCMAKNILPQRPLKVTIADYWQVINEAIPTILNHKNKYHKNIRFLVLYTEYFKTGEILDTFQLQAKINSFKNYTAIMNYVHQEVPAIMQKNTTKSYAKRFFYTQAGYYKDLQEYDAQSFLYTLSHEIAQEVAHG